MIFVFEQVTGKKLLEKGELQRRYTIIPLNKISAKTLNDRVVSAAKSLVRDLNIAQFGKLSRCSVWSCNMTPSP